MVNDGVDFQVVYRDCCVNMDVQYAKGNASGWMVNTLISQGDTGEKNSIFLDHKVQLHVSFSDWEGALRYVYGTWGSWTHEHADSNGFGGTSVKLSTQVELHT